VATRTAHPVRRVFDVLERSLGEPLEQALSAPSVSAILLGWTKSSRSGLQQIRNWGNHTLHLWLVPTYDDIQQLSVRVSQVQQTLRELSERLDDLEDEDLGAE
jgi:hypothetical protein